MGVKYIIFTFLEIMQGVHAREAGSLGEHLRILPTTQTSLEMVQTKVWILQFLLITLVFKHLVNKNDFLLQFHAAFLERLKEGKLVDWVYVKAQVTIDPIVHTTLYSWGLRS